MSNVPMTLPQLAISIQARPFSHTSSYVELEDGRIIHCSHRVREWSDDGGLTWSDVVEMQDINGDPVGGSCTCLVKLSDKNSIGLAAQTKAEPDDPRWEGRQMLFWRSDDNGETWQPPVPISKPGIFCQALQDTMLRTSSGRIILPTFSSMGQPNGLNDRTSPMTGKLVHNQFVPTAGHFFDPHFSVVVVYYSDDDGQTWQRNADGALITMLQEGTVYSYVNEPTITEVKPDRLLMFMRTGLGRVFQAWSNDNGETWTRTQPTVLASSTTPSQLRTLPNGHLLCVWNQETASEIKRGQNRTRLSSAISRDGGRVWEFFQNIQSIHETTRVEPGPIEPTHPMELYFSAGHSAVEREVESVHIDCDAHTRHSYPSVFVDAAREHVIVATSLHGMYEPDPVEAKLAPQSTGVPECGQQRKILPFKWFYGGKEPADNPFLKEAYEPAKP